MCTFLHRKHSRSVSGTIHRAWQSAIDEVDADLDTELRFKKLTVLDQGCCKVEQFIVPNVFASVLACLVPMKVSPVLVYILDGRIDGLAVWREGHIGRLWYAVYLERLDNG